MKRIAWVRMRTHCICASAILTITMISSPAAGQTGLSGCRKDIIYPIPSDQVEKGLDVVGATVLILQVVGMLPDIEPQ